MTIWAQFTGSLKNINMVTVFKSFHHDDDETLKSFFINEVLKSIDDSRNNFWQFLNMFNIPDEKS